MYILGNTLSTEIEMKLSTPKGFSRSSTSREFFSLYTLPTEVVPALCHRNYPVSCNWNAITVMMGTAFYWDLSSARCLWDPHILSHVSIVRFLCMNTWGVSSFEILWVKMPQAFGYSLYKFMRQFLLGNDYLEWDCLIIKAATYLPSQGAAGFQNGLDYFALFLPT